METKRAINRINRALLELKYERLENLYRWTCNGFYQLLVKGVKA